MRHGRRAALVLGGASVEVQRVQAEGDCGRALELLAGAEADGAGRRPVRSPVSETLPRSLSTSWS